MRKVANMKLADKLHHAFVYVCIGASVFTAINLVYMGYNYYAYVKPLKQKEQLRLKQELLNEGIAFEAAAPNSS